MYCKNWFFDWVFMLGPTILLMLTLEVWSLSVYCLISIWTTCWWNLNKSVWSKVYKILSFLTKNGSPFLTKRWFHLENISVTDTIVWCKTINSKTIIFQCSKHYSPTGVTRLSCTKQMLNMAEPNSVLTKRDRSLNKFHQEPIWFQERNRQKRFSFLVEKLEHTYRS